MDSPGSARGDVTSRLPVHLQQPSSSSFSDPEVFTSTHNIRPGQTFVSVQTLTKESFHVAISSKTKVHDVLWKCGERLSLSDDKLFGLAFRQPTEGIGGDQPRHEYYFLDPAAKIMKYAQKQPRFANWHSKSSENRPILVLYFRVRVYIDQVGLLSCPKAREHYYLQLKDNFLDHWAGRNSVSEERCWYMAALALITDKGNDYLGYFRAEQYFPLWVINERGLEYIRNNLPAACEDIINEGRYKAMEKFMIEAGRSPFALNCHLYGLRRHKMDNTDNAVLGINAKGIEMCDIGEDGDRIPLRSLSWSRVAKLSFNRKKMTIIGSDGTKMSLYAQTEHKAKYLLELCKAVHQTLLVMSHLHATMAPPPKPYLEMSVDGISTSSTSGIGSGDHDKDSDSLSSACGDRCHGSMSSKLRLRIKMDSNLDVKIEKMELDHIRQERAASQSSKASDESERSRLEVRHQTYHPAHELSGATSSTYTVTTAQDTATRPSSMDNASQTIESGSSRSIVDVNFNNKNRERHESSTSTSGTHVLFSSKDATPPIETAVVSSTMSMSVPLDSDTNQSINDRLLSMSASDLRAMAERSYSPPAQWTTNVPSTGSSSPPEMMARDKLTRSETRIDSQNEMWLNQPVESFNGGGTAGRFVKKNSSGNRNANAINRVHSMPSHYHVNGYYRNSNQILTYEDAPIHHGPTLLTHAQSLHVPGTVARPRNPPPYESTFQPIFAVGPKTSSSPPPQSQPSLTASTGPLPAEIAGDRQASFPPASVTPTQFLEEAGAFSTEKMENYPLILQLLKEHRQSQGQLNAITMTNGIYNSSQAGILSHNRRPSSCNDLSSLDGGVINGGAFVLPTHRGDYYFDSATLSQNLHLSSFVPMTTSTTTTSSATMTSSLITASSHQQPLQPSQQHHQQLQHQQSIKPTNNFARIEQHNGDLILPPPPPYQQPQQLVN
ncbi:FERM domain-containing protein [Caenorhabditis elegans]|uniref:FERM domain-containing protein n=1 Tax=Caenorhabditis elegans TaxID=6239 RepID=Q9XXK4_CAEEL|nr:FERM domain-containing protein [Caenorhabditis elegans]CAA19422.2 FERM domain-containing protein [Caenorhabditis elegans]|eukprot:NP_506085.2 FERM domain (protein4.1-ezrin-radixin-moesin) family [Caenorhabditis elegans]